MSFGTGKLEGVEYEEGIYEGYGLDGVAFIVDYMTDNKNRTLGEVRRVFNRAGGVLASAGSVGWQFEQKGYITLNGHPDFDEVFMVAAEAGATRTVSAAQAAPASIRNFILKLSKYLFEPHNARRARRVQ